MPSGFLPTQEDLPRPPQPEAAPVIAVEESPLKADEQVLEQLAEADKDTFLEKVPEEAPTSEIKIQTAAEGTPVAAAPSVQKDEIMVEVEKILEEEMGAYFETMPEEAKARFQKKGKEVAKQIAVMVRTFRVKIKTVLHLIRDWLLTIPGVNKFFLEQEAKIKTDKILEYAAVLREESKNKI